MEFPTLTLSSGQRAHAKSFAYQQSRVSYPEALNATCVPIADRAPWVRRRNPRAAGVICYFDPEGVLSTVRWRQRTPDIQITDQTGRRASGWLVISCCEGTAPSSSGGFFSSDTAAQHECASGKKVATWLR